MARMAGTEGSIDATTERLSDYACTLAGKDVTPDAVRQVKRTLVDTLGCGGGAFESEPAAIARRLAARASGTPPARVLGTAGSTSLDLAAFANTVLVRYLDGNDTYVACYPAESCTRVEVTTTDGRRLVAETRCPRGHHGNPLTDAEVETKFRGLASAALGVEGCTRALAESRGLDAAANLDGLLASLVVRR